MRMEKVNLPFGTVRFDPGTTKNPEGPAVSMTPSRRAVARSCNQQCNFVLWRKGGRVDC
jgi:hypothetical protein